MRTKSPRSIFIPSTWPQLSTALLVALSAPANGGDILRGGGAPGPSAPVPSAGGNEAGGVQAAVARANAADALARTTQAIAAVQQLQLQARTLASAQNNAGAGLPVISNGLGTGALQIAQGAATNASLWSGANLPTQTTRTENGVSTEVVTVKQNSQQALLTWETFNVGRGTELYFDQTAGGANRNQWIAFNNVNDPSGVPSQILGSIKAEGQVYVINQNGIIFGGASQVNAHTLVASSLPLNDNLVNRGLLNNPDSQFLFSSLPQPTGTNGTPATTPPPTPAGGRIGDVTVQAGARLLAPTSADKVGGRIALIGPNVNNAGTIETPDGQTILAAGLQLGFTAHNSNDPTLRGLDVWVGAVTDPASVIPSYAGAAVNSGLISAARASVTITGKNVTNTGAIDSSTSVSLNGRIDLTANYNAVSTNGQANAAPFLYRSTGTVTLGEGSTARILPERASTERVVGTRLALNSKVNITGQAIHFAENSTLLAPNADVAVDAGVWNYFADRTPPESHFVHNSGQIYFSGNALLNVAGSTDVLVPASQNFVRAELRASELADSPLLRNSALRGQAIIVDIRNTGTYNGRNWVGSPIADVSGYANLIERTAGELTIGGGTVKLNAGGSVVMQPGAAVDVSDGWIQYTGATVATTKLLSDGRVIDIAAATPDRVYDGIYTGNGTADYDKWSITDSYTSALGITGRRTEPGLLFGAAGGTLTITSPGMALDGVLRGISVVGPRQRNQQTRPSELTLTWQREELADPHYAESPTPPAITFGSGILPAVAGFALDSAGRPLPLTADRLAQVLLPATLFSDGGFGALRVNNGDGDITVPAGTTLAAPALGTISLAGANVTINGSLIAPGGAISLTATAVSPFLATRVNANASQNPKPGAGAGRGTLLVSASSTVSTAGLQVDDRLYADDPVSDPAITNAGSISLSGYHTALLPRSVIDVSGGALVSPNGRVSYGTGGSLTIRSGQDVNVPSVTGGTLNLGSALLGYSGGRGATLSITAPAIQVGGTANADTLLLQPDFFRTGGFTAYALTGFGIATGTPGISIAPGTQIMPAAQNWLAETINPETQLVLRPVWQQEGVRTAASVSFSAPGIFDPFSGVQQVRGDLVMGEGATIQTDARASVALSGETVDLLGQVIAPAGGISVSAGRRSQDVFPGVNDNAALTTLRLGARSVLSAAGRLVLTPNGRGYRTGTVYGGGSVSVGGNIVAEAGSLIDVSGTTGELDVQPGFVQASQLPNTSLGGAEFVRTRVDSAGGSISFSGGQQLYLDSTLRGTAGGPGTLGGSLTISSGRFFNGAPPSVLEPTLKITQAGTSLPAGGAVIGMPVTGSGGVPQQGMGYFTADQFNGSGLSALTLSGSVQFAGNVSLAAQRSLSVATSGILVTDSSVNLTAPTVALGQRFIAPQLLEEQQNYAPFTNANQPFYFLPAPGNGTLTVNAKLIDAGNLSLQGIGTANLLAGEGDIRGNGTLHIAGSLLMRAGQIYPTTAGTFNIIAYNNGTQAGTVNMERGVTRQLPWSAGGTLNVFASVINQSGVLRAPTGTINLGWDGSGAAPKDPITNQAVPETTQLTLGSGGVTSVSSIDPLTGQAVVLPYGLNFGGSTWIDPSGTDITRVSPPSKGINLAGLSVNVETGSTLDVRGGGDLYAYRWIQGNGGTRDVLNSSTSFAVIPGYAAEYAPYAPFNPSTLAVNLGGDAGYVNSTLSAGDQIYLNAGKGLAAGFYTLLPARYALLPGAFLVTPKSGTPGETVFNPDNSSLVAGYRFNAANPGGANTLLANYEIASSAVVRTLSQFEDFRANTFFTQLATGSGTTVPRLPADAGRVLLSAALQLAFAGTLTASAPAGARGALVDISSPLDILIAGPGVTGSTGALTLNSADLSSFSAQSLLIGGVRQIGPAGTTVSVKTGSLTVDNAGAPLTGGDIILVSSGSITLAENSEIEQTGTGQAETLVFGNGAAGSGNGTLLRLSGDTTAQVLRNAITSAAGPVLTIGAGAQLKGTSLTLDSTAATTLDATARLLSQAINVNSGRISLALDNPGALQPDAGLVLTGTALSDLQNAANLSFLSYSSLDIYGTGQVGRATTQNLALHAAQIRGFNNGGGTATFSAQNVLLDNVARGSLPGTAGPAEGTLAVNAGVIRTGADEMQVDQFSRLEFNATGGILMQGSGGLNTSGAAALTTPLLAGGAGAVQSLRAAGALDITAAGTATITGGLGARLTLAGGSVTNSADIVLPSGEITLQATAGNVVAGGRLDTAGTSRQFYDLTKQTDGGTVTLQADAGSVSIPGTISVAAPAAGGNSGSLTISAPRGGVDITGTLFGAGGAGGRDGAVAITSGALPSLASLDALLNAARFTESRSYRAVNGDVAVDGTGRAHSYSVSADRGSIRVTGEINASGTTGGSISLQAHGDVTLAPAARLNASAQKFDAAGKGGSIYLSAGTQRDGAANTGAVLDLQSGSIINLSVAATAAAGQASGTLHLRAPQNNAGNDVQINPIGSAVTGASAITVEGYRVFDLTGSGGTINAAVQTNVMNSGTAFGGATDTMLARLFGTSPLRDLTGILPGAEILNRTGDLTLAATWDLSTFRFGPGNAAPGVLTLRAAGNLNFNFANSLTDGFGGAVGTPLWQQPLLATGTRSWTYHLSAGAEVNAADYRAVQPLPGLAAGKGSLVLGSNGTASMALPTAFVNTLRDSIITPRYQTIRTGTGDIIINAGRDVQFLNPLGTIYTAGTQAAAMANFDLPNLNYTAGSTSPLGISQIQFPYAAQYSQSGGNVSISAGQDIARYRVQGTGANAVLLPDSTREMPTNWLYRRGYVDPATGQFAVTRANSDVASTSWWVDFSNFFEGVGAMGGGNITMTAGRDVANVDAAIPTNARMQKGTPDAGALLELGGGDLTIRAGRDLDGGVYYVERGAGTLAAGNNVKTNATRAALPQDVIAALALQGRTPDPTSWLPTTLFAGKSAFEVSARGNVLLGQVANAFLLPQGINNTFHAKTYLSTYSQTAGVTVSSLGGNVTLQSNPTGERPGTLAAWYDNVLRYTPQVGTFARSQPWLRLAETDVAPFATVAALMPGTLRATAFSGDINIAGNLTLSPAAAGTVDFAAAGAINGLQPNSVDTVSGSYQWGSSTINLSDTDPSRLPGITAPLNLPGQSTGTAWIRTLATVLDSVNFRFSESGSTTGTYAVLQTKQALHAPGLLHANDTQPLRLYAGAGNISGLTLFGGKAGRIFAGADITDVSLYLQNVRASDISVVASGRDIIAYNPNSTLRTRAQSPGNILLPTAAGKPAAGDLQISGPGTLEVLAGRHLDLGVGPINSDRTALGLTSIGNARNPSLPFEGARLVAGAGLGAAGGTQNPNLDYGTFIEKYVTAPTVIGEDTHHYLAELLGGKSYADFKKLTTAQQDALIAESRAEFDAMPEGEQKLVALDIFYRVLRDTGRARSRTGNYTVGEQAIATLFKGSAWLGDIALTSRQIKTQSGGDISLFAPGGKLTVGLDSATAQGADQGILTESGGTISIFTHNSVVVGTSRIFTLRGGDEMIWSSVGDIAAGASSKTVASAPPTRVLIDPQSGDVKTDLAGLATGGGIGVLATVAGVAPGNVDLIAPKGTIDAGDAGIRVTGNINIAANAVTNAGNIAAGGTTSGAPSAPAGGGTTAAPPPTPTQPKQDTAGTQTDTKPAPPPPPPADPLSEISVELLGFGGGRSSSTDDEEEEEKRREQKQEEETAKPAE
jgi:filamentous hemagglutinin